MPERGQSALVVPVPGVEALVSRWRDRHDRSAAQGMGAHITVLFPFLPDARLSADVLAQLRVACGAVPVMEVSFARTARFPGVLYIDPEPADALRELTLSLARRWPEAPPYGGRHADVVPHLTVAFADDDATLDEIDTAVTARLPTPAVLSLVTLSVFDGARWHRRAEFRFGASAASEGG
jgi:2'-5' RNA ligase